MFEGVTVVAGPAGSGKTERLLVAYRQALALGRPGSALWLSPTVRSSLEIRQRLLGPGLHACFSPNCLTFARFAEQVLSASGQPMRRLTQLMKRELIAQLIGQHLAAGTLAYFSPIAGTPGLVDLVDQFIAELKRLEVWPEEFAQACRARGMSAKDRELLGLYEGYQNLLVEHELYDAEGCHWSARTLLTSGQRRPYENLQLVVVDGFTDFTRTQHEILEELARRVRAVVISLPIEIESAELPVRHDLFAKTHRTLEEQLRSRHPRLNVEYLPRPAHTSWPVRAHLESKLFHSPRHQSCAADTADLEVVGAAGKLAEIELVGARIKRLLIEGDATGPVPPRDVLVVFRNLADVGPLVREVFTEMGIPVSLELRPPLSGVSPLAALLAVLQLDLADWPFRNLLAVLGHNCLQPDCYLGGDRATAHVTAVAAAEHLVRALQMPAGREQLLSVIERWAQQPPRAHAGRAEPAVDRSELRRRRAVAALPLVKHLAKALQSLPTKATPKQWVDALQALVGTLGLMHVSPHVLSLQPRQGQIQRIAVERFFQVLSAFEDLAQWLSESPPQWTRSELAERVAEILRSEELPPESDDIGRVRVLSAVSARNLSAPYVFLCGLAEKSFPAAVGDGNVYSEAETLRLIGAGLPLSSRVERSQDEMLLFYEIVTRATRYLWLSYPALDDKAQPLSPSPYLDEVERACGITLRDRTVPLHLSPVPNLSAVSGPRDLRVAAMSEALDRRTELLSGLCDQAPPLGDGLLGGVRSVEARQSRGKFGFFEGILDSPAARELLAQRFGPERCWSASQLETYAVCPYRFFAERVLHLEPLEDLALEADYLARGRMLHGALATLHRRVNQRHAGPSSVCADEAAEFTADVEEILQVLYDASGKLQAVDAALREIDRRLVKEWFAKYRQQHDTYDKAWKECDEPLRPAYFETGFGPQHAETLDPDSADPDAVASDSLSNPAPYEIHHAGETIKLTGRIDRIDVGRVDGKTVFNILDYKSGSARRTSQSAIDQGLALQLPLYALAVEELLLASQAAVPWQAGYWYVKKEGFKSAMTFHERGDSGMQLSAAWLAQRRKLLERVVSLVRGIRSGHFPVFSADDDCTSTCEFRTVCRVGQVRSIDKIWQAPVETAAETQ